MLYHYVQIIPDFSRMATIFSDLRLINLKAVLQAGKECKPNISIIKTAKTESLLNSRLTFAPRSIGVEIVDNLNIGRIQQEPIKYVPIINPRSILPLIDSERKDEIGLPTLQQEEKQAARLIVIRKKKMKKHQRRKLWKRMRHRWARVS